jgi:hypothetical protein
MAVAITDVVKIAGNSAGWRHSLPLAPQTRFVLSDEHHSVHHGHTPTVAVVPSLQIFPPSYLHWFNLWELPLSLIVIFLFRWLFAK